MKRLVMVLLLGVCAFAQDRTTQIVELKYLEPNSVKFMIGAFRVELNEASGSRFISLTGSKENVAAAEEALKQIDVPKKNVDLTFHVLAATAKPSDEKLPPDLEPVVKQLKASFVYQGFHLVDTLQLLVQEGVSGSVTGGVPRESVEGLMSLLALDFRSTSVTSDTKGTNLHIERLHFRNTLPNGGDGKGGINYVQTGIETSIDVPEGKKVVVGKANMNGAPGAYFLIVTARVVN